MPDEELESGVTLVDDRASTHETSPGAAPRPILAGRYEIESLLGVGGMGAVYRARDRELDERVALKMLRRELVDQPGMLERFRTEVKAARKVTSPHVARTFDIGEDGGERFITMELVDGGSLGAEVERNPKGVSIERAIAIADQVCAGLAAAHAASVVHRDLKPDNILFTKDGAAKITDFGIAKIDADVRMTHGSAGTPAYMAPEQVTGDPVIDARADLYALGVMLFEMLTGELPWKGETVFAVASARLLAAAPDVRTLRPSIPTALGELVSKLMARDKAARPPSATDVAEALRRIDPAKRATNAPPARTEPPRAPPAIAARFTTVAVLPFANRGAADDAFLGEAMAEEIIDALSTSRGLRVFARGAVMPYAGTTRDPRDVGRELDAHAVVHGTLQRNGDTVRASARLVSVADGLQLWAAREDRPIGDLLAAGADLARGIAAALAVEAKPRHAGTRDPAALELYLRGRRAYYGADEGGRFQARNFFEKAFALAPHDPAILAGLALTSALASRTSEDLAATVRLAEEAVSSAPESPEARYALATVRLHENRFRDGATEMQTALDLAPSSAEAHLGVGALLGEVKRFDEALEHLTFARLVDPTMLAALYDAARIRALRDGVDRGIDILESVPSNDRKAIWWLFRIRLGAWRDFGELEALVEAVRRTTSAESQLVRSVVESFDGNGWPITEHGSSRRRGFARQIMAELAGAHGDVAAAFEHVREADQAGVFDLAWLELCPALARVREDPRYGAIHASVAARAKEIASALAP